MRSRVVPTDIKGVDSKAVPTHGPVTVRDFPITGRDGKDVDLRVYIPASSDPTETFPVLAWSHGGGWLVGSLETDDPVCRYIARWCRIVVVSIGYGLLPENKFPVPLTNVHDAIRSVS